MHKTFLIDLVTSYLNFIWPQQFQSSVLISLNAANNSRATNILKRAKKITFVSAAMQ